MDEIELILSCQQSNRKAQEFLFSRFSDLFYRISMRYVQNQPDAEDIVITAFTRIFKTINTFSHQGPGSLEAWLRKIVVNEALQWLRRRHNFNMTEALDYNREEPDLKAISELEAEDILKIVSELPVGYRTVFILNVVEGYDHKEIGKLLSITEGTSRSQLFKAKHLLKKRLTNEGYHYGT